MKRLLIVLPIVIGGCAGMNAATHPTKEQIDNADYASAPSPDSIEPAIRDWAIKTLKDPASMQLIDLSMAPEKGWISVCTDRGFPPYTQCVTRMFYFGHLVTARLNAKNSMGGYGGYKKYTFLFRGNSVTGYSAED